MKRFAVTSIIRDKEYALSRGNEGSEILYMTANPNGEAEVITINLKFTTTARVKMFDVNFADLAIKGRDSMGNIVTKYPVRKVIQKEKGVSTLSAQKIWFDDTVRRINSEERGTYIGEFAGDDKILVVTQDGNYRLSGFDLTAHFEEDIVLITKYNDKKALIAVYWEGEKKKYYIKRFVPESTDKKVIFISETQGSQLEAVTDMQQCLVEIKFSKEKGKELPDEKLKSDEVAPLMGMKAQGKPLNYSKVKEVQLIPDPNAPKEETPDNTPTPKGGSGNGFDFEDSEMSPVEEFRSKKETPVKKAETGKTKKSAATPAPVELKQAAEDGKGKKKKGGPSQMSLEL